MGRRIETMGWSSGHRRALVLVATLGSLACQRLPESTEPHAKLSDAVSPAPSSRPGAVLAPPALAAGGSSAGTTAPVEPSPPQDFFSLEWARRQSGTDVRARTAAERLRRQGRLLYAKHDETAAVARYEQALGLHASGLLYYNYGNSLSNLDRLDDAVKAYGLALALDYEHPELVIYAIACAHSRRNDAPAAYAALGEAIAKGFAAFAKLETDPDLAFLRARPDWAERLSAWRASPALTGKVVALESRVNDVYTVCPSGRVIQALPNGMDKSCCHSTLWGTLAQENGKFVVHWSQRCGYRGAKGLKYPGQDMEICQPYNACSSELRCSAQNGTSEIMPVADLPKLLKHVPSDDDEPGDLRHYPFKGGVPPECTAPIPHG